MVVQAASPGKAYLQDQQALTAVNMLAKRQFEERLRAVSAPTRAAATAEHAASPERFSPTKKQRQGASPVASAEAAVAAAIAARMAAVAAAAGAGSSSSGGRLGSPKTHRTPKSKKTTPKRGEQMRKALRVSSSRAQQGAQSPAPGSEAPAGSYSAGQQHMRGSPVAGASNTSSPRNRGTPGRSAGAGGSYASPGSGLSAGCSPGSAAKASQWGVCNSVVAQTALAQFWVSGGLLVWWFSLNVHTASFVWCLLPQSPGSTLLLMLCWSVIGVLWSDTLSYAAMCCAAVCLQAQQRAADSSVAQQTLIQQLVQQSNLLKQRIELICSHALKRQQQKQELEQQQQQQEAEEEVEAEALQQQQDTEQHEQEQMRLTMSGAKKLADQLLTLLDKQQLSASGATVAAAHVAAAGDMLQQQAAAAAATWQQQLKQQLQQSSNGLSAGASADGSAVSHQKLRALLDAQAVIQGLLPQRNTSSGAGSYVIGTVPSADQPEAEGDTTGNSQSGQGPSGSGGRSRLGYDAASRPLELDLDLSSPEDTSAGFRVDSRGSQQGTGTGAEGQEQELPFQQRHQHHADSAVSSLESDLARRATPAARPAGRRRTAAGHELQPGGSPAAELESPSPAAAAPEAGHDDLSGGVTWYYSALGGEGAWDASPGGYDKGQHGSASAAAAAAQAARAASAAAVRASSHLLGLTHGSDPDSPEEEVVTGLGFTGQHLQVHGGLHDVDPDLGEAFATPEVAAAADLAADGSSSGLRQRWNLWRLRYQQTVQQQHRQGPDDQGGDDQEHDAGGDMALQMPRWSGQPVWAVAGVSGYR